MRDRRSAVLLVIIVASVAVGVAYAIATPTWQAPDEPAHYSYVRYLIEQRALPVLQQGDYDFAYLERIKAARFPPDMSIDSIRYESHQPPLYYLLSAVVAAPLPESARPLALRLFSVLLGACLLGVAYRVIGRLFPDRPFWTLGAVAFIAFLPMHLAETAAISNDTLAEVLLALVLGSLLARLDEPATLGSDLGLGVFLGLCLLTKTTAYVALLLTAIVLIGIPLLWSPVGTGRSSLRRQAASVAIALGVALLIGLPWFVRNAIVYGGTDILGLARHDAIMTAQPHTADWLAQMGWVGWANAFVSTTFHSFWGQFGWMGVLLNPRIYAALALLSAVAVAGAIVFVFRDFPRLPDRQRAGLAVFALAAGITLGSYLWYNVQYVQHQGRYLFPALIPLATFFALGLWTSFGRREAWAPAAIAWTIALIGAVSSLPGGSSDKVVVAMAGVTGVAFAIRALLPEWRPVRPALYALVFAALAVLAVLSLSLFIVVQLMD